MSLEEKRLMLIESIKKHCKNYREEEVVDFCFDRIRKQDKETLKELIKEFDDMKFSWEADKTYHLIRLEEIFGEGLLSDEEEVQSS